MKNLFRHPDRTLDKQLSQGERIRVAVVSACAGSGASYVASQIIKKGLITGHTPAGMRTLVELGSAHFYEALGMDKRFLGREFYDFESGRGFEINEELGANWYLRRSNAPIDDAALFKAVAMAPGNLLVFDFSGMAHTPSFFKALDEMDTVYLVIDPLPSRLIASWDFIAEMRKSYPEAVLVVNKFNEGIHKGQLSAFLGTQNYYVVPAADTAHIYASEYNCVLP